MNNISIRLMEGFSVTLNGETVTGILNKSRKGVALIQYLILAAGEPVTTQQLMTTLWPDDRNTNPENALKTLVSRTRTQMNQLSEDFGRCIVADRGAYHWMSTEGVTVDLISIERIFNELETERVSRERRLELFKDILRLYSGDFLRNEDPELDDWAGNRVASLHSRYMSTVYEYLNMLKEAGENDEIILVCRQALSVSSFDDRLHIELISALMANNRANEAMQQYKTAEQMNYRYLGQPPSRELQDFYRKCINAGNSLDFSMEAIMREMQNNLGDNNAYVCEYPVFREIYGLLLRNAERSENSMNLVLIQLGNMTGQTIETLEQDNMIQSLIDILRKNLRRGDLITRYSPNVVALLLQMRDPAMGEMVIERIRREFYVRYSNSRCTFKYRTNCLHSGMKANQLSQK